MIEQLSEILDNDSDLSVDFADLIKYQKQKAPPYN